LIRKATETHEQGAYEQRFLRPDGSIGYYRSTFQGRYDDEGNLVSMVGTVQDITERRQAEESLAVSEANLLSLLESTDDIIVSRDRDGRVIAFNKAFASITRNFFGVEARPGIRVSDFMTAEQKAQWEDVLTKVMSGEAHRHEFSWEFGGSTHHYELALTPIRVGAEIVGTAEFTREITARKRAEAERERLMAAIEQTGEMVIVTDPKGSIQYVNPAFETVTGYSRGETIGRNPRLLKSGEQDEAFYRELWQTIASGRTWQGRIINTRKDGTHYPEEATISPVSDPEGRIVSYVAVKRDISAQRLIEDKLLQAQKMETVGQLAGGVAHDFNNMLQVIISYVEMSLATVKAGQPLFQNLMEIQRAAQRSAEMTGQLLAFARKQTASPKVLDLNESVAGTQKMIQRLIGEEIDLVWMPGHDLWKVKIDPIQLDQILANLAVNARDAIGGVGKVVIGTQKVSLDEAYCAAHAGTVPGDFVVLAVRDDGRGMDRETMSHLFEPFFTTKGPGKGTGLGLATIYGIVKQNNGFIDVSSEPGQGTTFGVYLPRIEGETMSGRTDADVAASRRGTETLLVVEDEPAILALALQSLTPLGYTVLTASSPHEAMRKSRELSGQIHLLITDVVMPQMNGRQLVERLRAARPGLKCLFMSGYTADVIAHRGVLDEGVSFIAKPFSLITLAEKVREVLDG
jgi:PAS domain S-box-containing protein